MENFLGEVHLEDVNCENGRIFERFEAGVLLVFAVACVDLLRDISYNSTFLLCVSMFRNSKEENNI